MTDQLKDDGCRAGNAASATSAFFIVGNIAIIERSFLNIILIMKYLHVIQKTGLRKSLSAVRVKRHFRFILMKLGENID